MKKADGSQELNIEDWAWKGCPDVLDGIKENAFGGQDDEAR